MIVWLLAIGLVSMLGQVVLLRELNVAFYGSELIYILALGLWLFWTAVGASLGRRRSVPSAAAVRRLLFALAVVLPLAVVFVRGLRLLFGGVPGAYLPFPRQLLAVAVSLLPVSVLLGLLFQWAAKRFVSRSRTLAGAYAVECAGGVAGGILATLLLVWGVPNFDAALLCGALCAAAAVPPLRGERSSLPALATLLGVGLVLLAIVGGTRIDRWLTTWNHPGLVATRDSPYGRVSVVASSGQISVFENDALAFDSEGTAAEEFVHLAALQHPAPSSVLVLGGGIEGLVAELLLHRPERIDYVELNRVLLDLLSAHLPDRIRGSLASKRVRVHVADPRRFLAGADRYDLILIGMPEPASGQANRFYTREFFDQCARRLSPRGVLALRLRGAENLWTPQLALRTASIHRALVAAFDDVVVLPGVTNIVLASPRPLSRDPLVLAERLRERGVEARLVIPAYVEYLYTNDRFFEIERRLAATDAAVNTDIRPVCYQYTLLIWLSQFFPRLALVELPVLELGPLPGLAWFWIAIAAVSGLMLASRIRPAARSSLLAAAAGFVGMVLETTLILQYQTSRGVLFRDLGLLLTLFMAGLVLGAVAVDRHSAGRDRPHPAVGAVVILALAGLNLLTAWLIQAGALRGLGGIGLVLLAGGFLVSAAFAYASLCRRVDQRSVVSTLYAADLIGGSLGSLAACLFLIPLAGLSGSAMLMAWLAALALILI